MPDRSTILTDAIRTRAARALLIAVFVIVLAVEAIFLFNAMRHERQTALDDLNLQAQLALSALFLTHPYPMTDKLLLATSELLLPGSPISGGAYLRDDGSVAGVFGIPPDLRDGQVVSGEGASANGQYLEIVWPTAATGAPYAVAVRLDITGANLRTNDFISRVMTISMALTAIVGLTIIAASFKIVLLPLARLRRSLGLAPGRADTIDAEWTELVDAALRRERAPRLENPDVERRVEERTAELRKEIEKRAETEVKLSRLAQMTNDAIGPMFRLNEEGRVLYANEQARKLMAAWGTVPGGILPGRWRDRFVSFMQRGKPGSIEEMIENKWLQFSVVPYPEQAILNIYGFDVTDRPRGSLNADRNSREATPGAAGAATAVGLAVLSGRPALEERIAQGLAHALAHKSGGVLYFMEIEEFADIAKAVGHEAAVRFLGEIGSRLRTVAGLAPAILRLERCLFAIVEDGLHGHTPDTETAAKRAENLIAALTEPFRIDDQTVKTTASIGITAFPSDGGNVAQLIGNAEMALDHAKGEAPNAYRFFMAATNEIVDQRTINLNSIKHAVTGGEFALHFQPRLDIKSCRIRAAEALIRWPDSSLGSRFSQPNSFLPIVRDAGLMETLGKWALHSACKANKGWQNAGLPFIRVAVNIPAELIEGGELASIVADVLRRNELDADYLEIDIGEVVAAEHLSETSRAFDDLRDIGVATAVDGFSGGHLSLRDLCAINPKRLKLRPDQVTAVGADPMAGQTVRAAIVLAGGIDAAVTAIGAETSEQVDFLHTLKVDELQGQAFSGPLAETAFKSFVDNFTEATLALPEGIRPNGLQTGMADVTRRLI